MRDVEGEKWKHGAYVRPNLILDIMMNVVLYITRLGCSYLQLALVTYYQSN